MPLKPMIWCIYNRQYCNIFKELDSVWHKKAVDVEPESITVEATGTADKLHALVTMLEPYGIIELVKSGQVALGRGQRSINEKNRAVLRAAQ